MPRAKVNRSSSQKHGKPLTPEAAAVLRKFRVIFNSVRRHLRTTEQKAGISSAHVWALGAIAERPGIGVSELAGALEIHQSTVSNLLKTLTAKRLVTADRNQEDKRSVRLFATAAGQKVLERAPNPYTGVLPEALLELDPRVLKRLDRDLQHLVAILSPQEDGAYVLLSLLPR